MATTPCSVIAHPLLFYQGVKLQLDFRRLGICVWNNITASQAYGDTYVEQVDFVSDGIQ